MVLAEDVEFALLGGPAGHSRCDDWVSLCSSRREGRKTLFLWPGQVPEEEIGEEEPLETDRPDFTEASSTVGRGRVQLEMGYTYIHDREGTQSVTSHSFPETLLRVGVLAEWLELRVAWNYGIETTRDAGQKFRISAADDLYVGVKFALTEQDGILPEMVLMPQATLPTAPVAISHDVLPLPTDLGGFGAGEVLPGVNWLYGWDVTDFLTLAGSSQVNRAHEDIGNFYTEFAQSVTVGYSLAENVGAYTEWFAFFPHGALDSGTRAEHYFDGGFTWRPTNDLQFDVRAGIGLNDSAADFFAGTGMALRY
jgi:hypothetical protein